MNRDTIDYGIDLGTTNSAIAVLNDLIPEIIKNNDSNDITPSAIGFSQRGAMFLGARARSMAFEKPEDAYVEFKRQMGTENEYHFKSSGKRMKPEDLSAEVLKQLKADVQQRCGGEQIGAAVITVPAIFELHQCDATRRAAELAGLTGSPLLQEPVAAALAHGFQADCEKAFWLVYDFGGGTFDAALIKAEEGSIHVVNHGGDNFLGGSDIDRALIDRVIAPKIAAEFGLKDFTRANAGRGQRWHMLFSLMKPAAEQVKIQLSRHETAAFELWNLSRFYPEFDSFECDITQREVIQIAEPIIRRSVEICRKVLSEKNLPISAVDRVILVGGPTLAGYFRDILRDGLNAKLDDSVDPLTVVAKGAAVFAGTQKVNAGRRAAAVAGEYSVDLKYKPTGIEPDPFIGGVVAAAGGGSVEGFTIEIINTQSHWRSGRISLAQNGVFQLTLLAEKGSRNPFTIELLDARGARQRPIPDSFTYTIGGGVDEQPVTGSIGVAKANNEVVWFFHKGAGLPLKKRWPEFFHTTSAMKQGDPRAALIIPVVEGENELGDRNLLIGSVQLDASRIKRDLPAGSEIEVTLKISESRLITVSIYIPSLDEEFDWQIELGKKTVSAPQLRSECLLEYKRLDDLLAKAQAAGQAALVSELRALNNSQLVNEIKENTAAADTDAVAAEKCERQLLRLKLELDQVENTLRWPEALAEAQRWIGYMNKVVEEHGNTQQREKAKALCDEIEEITRAKQMERIPRKLDQIRTLYFGILFNLPAYWVNQFQRLEKQKDKMTDRANADRLLELGRNYLANNNAAGLQNVVRQLWDLTPEEIVEEAKRGFQSTLI